MIKKNHDVSIDLNSIPLDNKATYDLLQKGDAKGVFQLDSSGIRELLKRMKPDNIRDMLAQRYQGSRYSFGYPACPNIQDQFKQLELLGVDRMKMHMDESEQLYPEQSTTAIITYHPAAKYFTA